MQSTRSPTEFDQNNRDVTSIHGYVIEKNSSRGAKRGVSERQKMYHHAKQILKKGPTGKALRAIVRYSHDGMPVRNTESHCMPSGGEKTTLYCTTGSPWRST